MSSQYSMLSSSRLRPAHGMEPCVTQPSTEVLRTVRFKDPIDANALRVKVDPVLAFNELVHGLFLGMPPWCIEHLDEAVEVSKRYQEIADMLKMSSDIDGYYRFAQAAAFLKKYEGMGVENERLATVAAVTRWYGNETLNRQKNQELWEKSQKPLTFHDDECMKLIRAVKEEIAELLGDLPPDFGALASFGKFGPGVTLTHRIDATDPLMKTFNASALVSQSPEVRWLCEHTLFRDTILESYGYGRSILGLSRSEKIALAMDGIEWVEYEKFATVPKDLLKRRSIGVGASLATWIQQTYDGFLRQRLKVWGLDLSDQQPNRTLAYLGSKRTDDLRPCTIDLTDASSRICSGLIALCFPAAWARLLFAQRAKYCIVEGKQERLEMFSAMGNALTFSLQTLIFSAVVRVVLRTQALKNAEWRVYGDDIIVPYRCFDAVISALKLLGFEPNTEKSFKEGQFRESCGEDYLHGTNVRPLFLKKPVTDVCEAYKVLNLIGLYAAEAPIPVWCYRRVWKYLLSTVPIDYRVFGEPSEVLDAYIWAPVQSVPSRVVGARSILVEPPEKWAYFRTLLTKSSADSHVREGKGYYDAFCLYKRMRVSGKRVGVELLTREWRWFRLLSVKTSRLKGLGARLLPLFS